MSLKDFEDGVDFNYVLSSFHDENFSKMNFINKFVDKALKEIDFSSLEACNFESMNRVIESSMKKLEMLQEEIITEMETIQLENELNHSSLESEQSKLVKDMDKIKKEFENLENKIIKFSDRSINLGNQLSSLDQSKEASIISAELIEMFMGFNSPDYDEFKLLAIDPSNFDEILNSAKYIFLLNEVAKNLNVSEFNQAKQNISKKYEYIKKRLVLEFNDSFSRKNNEKLKKLMIHIENFDLVSELATNYIKKAFKSVNIINIEVYEGLKTYEDNKKNLENCYRNILRILNIEFTSSENFFISIFPEDKQVDLIKLFISYAFENFVDSALRKVLIATDKFSNGNEMYLKYYELFYTRTEALMEDIGKMNSLYSSKLVEVAKANFHIVFDELHEKYFAKEKNYLGSILTEYTTNCNSKIQVDRERASHNKKHADKDPKAGWLSKEEAESRIESINEILTNEMTELLFNCFEHSAFRCYRLSKIDEKDRNTAELVQMFLKSLGAGLLNNLIGFSIELVPNWTRKTTLNEKYFDIIFKLNLFVQRIDISLYKTTQNLIKLKDYEELLNEKERISKNLETETLKSLSKAINSIKIHANKVLKQCDSKQEYYLKENKPTPSESSTVCKEFISYLSPYLDQIKDSYSDNLKMEILKELGKNIIDILIDYYATIKLNQKGLLQLSIDLEEYRNLIKKFKSPQVDEGFENFRSLVKIYNAHKDDLMNYISQEKKFEKIAEDIIKSYIENKPTK